MLMKMLMAILRLVPQKLAKNMAAPMMAKELLARGRDHPTIPMTLANLREPIGSGLYCWEGMPKHGDFLRELERMK